MIHFDIPGGGVKTILLSEPLPEITDVVTIDALTQPNADANHLLIELDGSNIDASGLTITSASSTIRGLIISRFAGRGISLSGEGAHDNVVEHNYIGVGADGTTALGNGSDGVTIDSGAFNNVIQDNRIANNGGVGIVVSGDGTGNKISQNETFDNAGLGIDLNNDGVSANDDGDRDKGANGTQNKPVLLIASPSSNDTVLKGRLNAEANKTYTLEFFANTSCTNSIAQGETFLESANVATDAQGNIYFSKTLANVLNDKFITATATSPENDTSEFSTCIPLTNNNQSWVNAQFLNIACPDADNPPPESTGDTQTEYIVRQDQARWYKFCVTPRSKIIITLTQLPADFDLTVFKDIGAQYQTDLANLRGASDPQEQLTRLGAEFAPDAFSPEAYSPEAYSPEAYSPEAYSAEAFSPEAYSPEAYSPEAYSPEAYSPEAYSPEAYSPEAYSPEAYSPDAFSPEAYSPEAYSPENFSPEAYSSAQSRSVIGVSAFPGNASEGIVMNTWDNTGEFYVRVRGKNGAFSTNAPFKITVTELTGACRSVTLPSHGTTLGGASNKSTLILWDSTRLKGSSAQIDSLQNSMSALAAASNGIVVDVSGDAKVTETNAQADSKPDCPFAKNLVASAIKDVINAYDRNKNLDYIVLVGNDSVIPFFRHPDQALLANEAGYVPPVKDTTSSQASLRLGYLLTQDPYGARTNLSLGSNSFAVPEIAVGRLVETAGEAQGMIDAFLDGGGTVPLHDGTLVTGYDFLQDAADAIKDELNAGTGRNADTLIAPNNLAPRDPRSWKADDLRAALLGKRHDIAFLAGHFSAGSTLAADFTTRLFASEIAVSNIDFTNALIYSAGCHSGYNVVDDHGIPNITLEPDWAQAFARKNATLIAGTGYQYGDTDVIEYSERLYLEFTRELRRGSGPVSIGQALVRAKQKYLASTPQLKGIHQKAVLQTTIFGLPMLTVNMPGARLGSDADQSIVSGTTPFTTNPGKTLGLTYADVTLHPSLTQKHTTLNDLTNNSSIQTTFFEGADGVVTNPTQPVLPLENENVSVNGVVLRGVGFRGGSYSDLANIIPLTGAPATEIRGVHIPYPSQVFFPVRPWNINYFDALGGGGGTTRLLVTPAQFKSNDNDPLRGTWRTFDSMRLRLFYSGNADVGSSGNAPALSAAPSISNIQASSNGSHINFALHVVGNPAAGIQQVWVTYTGVSGELAGQWKSLDLKQNATDSTLWQGILDTPTPPQDIRFMAQAVNGVGLTSLSTNQGAFYTPDGFTVKPPTQSATQLNLHVASSGAYGNQLNLTATLTSGGKPVVNERVWFGLGSQRKSAITNAQGVAQGTVSLLGPPGSYDLQASFDGKPLLAPVSASTDFSVTKQNTNLHLDPPKGAVQYSDDSGLSATVRDANNHALGQVSLAFVLNGTVDNASRLAITDLVSNATYGKIPGRVGSYNVAVTFGKTVTLSDNTTLDLTDARYNGSSANTNVTVKPEDAGIEYTGDTTLEVGADLHLAAKITQADDGSPGDITLGKVKFKVLNADGQVIASDTVRVNADGSAAATVSDLFGGVYTVQTTLLGGYFSAPDVNTPLTVTGDAVALSHTTRIRNADNKALNGLRVTFKPTEDKSVLKIRATKPTTFKYVEILNNTGDVSLGLTVRVGIPASETPPLAPAFCLVGANPVHVFSNADFSDDVTSKAALPSNLPQAGADADTRTCVNEVSVDVIVPAHGKRFITLELAYAGKGATGFPKNANKTFAQALVFTTSVKGSQALGTIRLPAALDSNSGVILVGNKLTGIGGFALDEQTVPRAGYIVTVRNSGKDVATTQIDTNGSFLIRLPADGPYKVLLRDPNTRETIAAADVKTLAKHQFKQIKWRKPK